MKRIVDIGRRIELVPLDPHFHDITLALYRQQREGKPVFLVHTYSQIEGARGRVQSIVQAMKTLGGMQETPDGTLCFHCGAGHEMACKRVFLEACKLPYVETGEDSRPDDSVETGRSLLPEIETGKDRSSGSPDPERGDNQPEVETGRSRLRGAIETRRSLLQPRPLQTLDKKSRLTITVDSVGKGVYRVSADGEGRGAARRVAAIASGLMKLGEMERVEDSSDTVAFACGHSHDALVGLLLVRAPNVRVVLREAEMEATRGVLSAPSQQL